MLEVQRLEASYGEMKALHGVDLRVKRGQIVALLGANGAGKTTLLRAISGVIGKISGTIQFEGKEISKLRYDRIVALGISHVPEGREVFPQLTVKENLLLGSYLRKDIKGIQVDMETILVTFSVLKDRYSQLAGTLSGGEQQMLAIARALMARPKLLLLDEPSLGLAPIIVHEIFRVIAEINKNKETTVFLVEQNIQRALKVSDYGYVLENGRVVLSGPSSELLEKENIKHLYLGENEGGLILS